MQNQNQYGQGVSHATGDSKVPDAVQRQAPVDLEDKLPDSIHDTSRGPTDHSHQTHAKDGGDASIVPKPIQKAVPEKLERALPNAIHDTGDQGGLHRKQ